MSALQTILEARSKYGDNEQLNYLGKEMFRMFTEMGFPPDIFLAELDKKKLDATGKRLELLEKVYIASVYQVEFMNHRRKAGIQEKNLPKLRRQNREMIDNLIKDNELGVY